VAIIFFGTLGLGRFSRRSAVLALANTYSNTAMIGIPLVGLAYGQPGLVTLFTLVSVHSLIMLTTTTVALEMALLREDAAAGRASERHLAHSVLLAVRNAVIHPVPLPIIAGLVFAWSGLVMPEVIDKPLALLSAAFGPLALILVGVTLAATPIGENWKGALQLSLAKNLLHPALVAAAGWALGLSGPALAVMVLASALPIGANVFLFAQRYKVAEDLTTASVAMSTLLGLATISLVLSLLTRIG
jgi:predicted permease